MPSTGFHSEWITVGHHRILLQCRASFPDDNMRFIAQVAATTCDANSEGRARVVEIHYDDKACIWMINVASTDIDDKQLEDALMTVFHTMYCHGNVQSQVQIVEEGNTDSDHYNRTEHLSIGADVAVNRWRHQDDEYQKTVQPPS